MKKRIYIVFETEADEDDKSIRSDIEQELGMATHYFEIVSYSESGFQNGWRSTKAVAAHDGSRVELDRENPRVEIEIEEMEKEK